MSKYLHRDKARQSPIYQAILEAAQSEIELHGCFSKETVLEKAGADAVADAIRWDYIREFLAAEYEGGVDLIPMVERYFKRHSKDEERINPERYIAQGHGKKCAGFAAVRAGHEHLVLTRVKQRKSFANGVGKAYAEFRDAIANRYPEQYRVENDTLVSNASTPQIAA
jgi:hypothetical protein